MSVEAGDIVQIQATVGGAAGNDHCARPDSDPARKAQKVRVRCAVKLFHFGRDGDRGAKLLRLHEGAAGQSLAGNAGGKTKVVFDAGAGTGLPAGRTRIGHQNG